MENKQYQVQNWKTLAKNSKNNKNGHFQSKKYHFWPFLKRGLFVVLWPVIQAYQRSTLFSHNTKKSALCFENSKNGGQKSFAIPCVNVPFLWTNVFVNTPAQPQLKLTSTSLVGLLLSTTKDSSYGLASPAEPSL